MFEVTDKLKSRFFAKVRKGEGDDACWEWIGAGRGNGYGTIKIASKCIDAHRVSFVLHGNELPQGTLVCHRCDNPSCVNPAHLFAGTYRDNHSDAVSKGIIKPFRTTRTEPLTDSEIETICDSYRRGVSRSALSRKFQLAHTSLDRVLSGAGLK